MLALLNLIVIGLALVIAISKENLIGERLGLVIGWAVSISYLWKGPGEWEAVMVLALLAGLWLGYWKMKNRGARIALIGLIAIITCLTVLVKSEIISQNGELDRERIFLVDGKYGEKIKDFQTNALYLPYKARSIFFNELIIIGNIISRGINLLWLDKMIIALGLASIYPLILGVSKQKVAEVIVIGLAAVAAGLHRNPNYQILHYFLLPAWLSIVGGGISKVSVRPWLVLVILGLIYQLA